MESESITELMATLALQLGIIFFAVRIFGKLVKKAGLPQVLGELIAGIVIGPYALGGIHLPGFPHGIFPLATGAISVSSELYAFATMASIILLFASGLETNLKLFLRYSLAGGLISIGGVAASFIAGDMAGMLMLRCSFSDPRCLFLGILIASNSLGIVARLLSEQKKMDSPEGVTILAASVFDDVYTIIVLAVVLGIVAAVSGQGGSGDSLHVTAIIAIGGKAFGIWLGVTAIGLICAKKLASFLKIFKSTFDFSILAMGLALILGGLFEKQGLAMIIGAYISGLSLSKTDIAPVIQERTHIIYDFFVPIFFAVTGMMVNIRDVINPTVLIFGAIYSGAAIIAKIAGCGAPALLLGFNVKGALRIGLGMAPRGEMTLILAGIALTMGILNQQIFAVLVLMILVTTLVAPPFLSAALKLAGSGTRKPVKSDDSVSMTWEFPSSGIANLMLNTLFDDLRSEGFFVQLMSSDKSLCQVRKDDVSITIRENENIVTIETAKTDMPFVKTAVYEVILELHESIQKLKDSSNPEAMKKELMDSSAGRTSENLLTYISADCISLCLKGETKEEVISEMVDMLAAHGKLMDRDMVLNDVLEREKTMSTGMESGVALPHGRTDGIADLEVAVGVKKEGIDFGAMDNEKSKIFILVVSPKKSSGPHIQFLAAISAILMDENVREALMNASSPEEAAKLLHAKGH